MLDIVSSRIKIIEFAANLDGSAYSELSDVVFVANRFDP